MAVSRQRRAQSAEPLAAPAPAPEGPARGRSSHPAPALQLGQQWRPFGMTAAASTAARLPGTVTFAEDSGTADSEGSLGGGSGSGEPRDAERVRLAASTSSSGMGSGKVFDTSSLRAQRQKELMRRSKSSQAMVGGSSNQCCMLDPSSTFNGLWDMWVVLLCLYTAIAVPFRIGFQIDLCPEDSFWWLELLIDVIFVVDIVLNFRTGVEVDAGVISMNANDVAYAYLKGWFFIDLLSVLPFSYIALAMRGCGASDPGSNTKVIKVFRLLKVQKMLKLTQLRHAVHAYRHVMQGMLTLKKVFKVLVAAVTILYCCHLVACMWFYFGTFGAENAGEAAQGGWIIRAGINTTKTPLREQYLEAFYWSITVLSTVGFGDITPELPVEKVFSIFAELVGCVLFAMLMGALGSLFVERPLDTKVNMQVEELRCGRMPLPACHRLDQVRRLTYKSLLDDVPLFKDAMGDEGDKALVQLSHLLSRFKTLVVPPGTAVYEEGSIANDFYLVIEGEIELQSSHSDVGWRISRGAAGGMFFGEHELFFGGGGSPQPSLRSDGGIEEQEVLRRTSSSSTEDGGRKRFHRAMVTSHTKAKLKFLRWSELLELRGHDSLPPLRPEEDPPSSLLPPSASASPSSPRRGGGMRRHSQRSAIEAKVFAQIVKVALHRRGEQARLEGRQSAAAATEASAGELQQKLRSQLASFSGSIWAAKRIQRRWRHAVAARRARRRKEQPQAVMMSQVVETEILATQQKILASLEKLSQRVERLEGSSINLL